MSPSKSKTIVWPSGDTSSDIQVPSSVVKETLASGFRISSSFFSSFFSSSFTAFSDCCCAFTPNVIAATSIAQTIQTAWRTAIAVCDIDLLRGAKQNGDLDRVNGFMTDILRRIPSFFATIIARSLKLMREIITRRSAMRKNIGPPDSDPVDGNAKPKTYVDGTVLPKEGFV